MTRYDFCAEYDDYGFAVVAKNGKFGVFNFFDNEEIIAPKYEKVQILDENFFAVKSFDGWGVLSKDNETIIPMVFQEIWHYNDYFIAKDSKNEYVLISKKDQRISSARYQKICEFQGDYAIVRNQHLFGVINKDLKEIIPTEYNLIEHFKDNLFFVRKNKDIYIVDSNNTCKLNLNYERVERLNYTPYFLVRLKGLYGLLDENQKWVMPAKYEEIRHMFGDYFEVILPEEKITYKRHVVHCLQNNRGVYNIKKGFILKPEYTYVSSLGGKMFYARKVEGLLALFNNNGEQLTDFIYEELDISGNAIIAALPAKDGSFECTVGLLDITGKTLIEPIYDSIESCGTGYVVWKDGKCGIIDSTYKLVSNIVFDEVNRITEKTKLGKKIAEVEYNHMFGYFYW